MAVWEGNAATGRREEHAPADTGSALFDYRHTGQIADIQGAV
jgi:hypothetical protein